MQGYEFLTAHFVNNERTMVEVYWANEDKTITDYVSAVEGDKKWAYLLEHIDIDQLHENTYKHIRSQNEAFEEKVMSIAKERGMLIDIDVANTDQMKALLGIIFEEPVFENPSDEEKHKEKLFALKLALFEFDSIRKSKNKDLKTQLRKAENAIDVMHIGLQLAKQKD